MWTLGNFSRYIRPGYYRLDLPGVDDLTGVMASAYKDPENSSLVVVVINAGSTDEQIEFNIDGLPAGKDVGEFKAYTTNAAHNLAGKLTAVVPGQLLVPAKSTVTFVATIEGK